MQYFSGPDHDETRERAGKGRGRRQEEFFPMTWCCYFRPT